MGRSPAGKLLPPKVASLEDVQRRYAAGELSTEEYEKHKARLEDTA